MKKLIVACSLLFTITSCYNVNESMQEVPENLITKDKLITVMTDIQLVEAGLAVGENRNFRYDLKPKYYKVVLDTHNISLLQLKQSINYYQASPKVMEEIYDGVLANLSKFQSEVVLEKEEFDRVRDSLAIVNDSIALVNTIDTISEK